MKIEHWQKLAEAMERCNLNLDHVTLRLQAERFDSLAVAMIAYPGSPGELKRIQRRRVTQLEIAGITIVRSHE